MSNIYGMLDRMVRHLARISYDGKLPEYVREKYPDLIDATGVVDEHGLFLRIAEEVALMEGNGNG